MTPLVIWSDVWAMSGIGFGVVFCVLVLLVYVLKFLGWLVPKFAKGEKPVKAQKQAAAPKAVAAAPVSSASDADKAAVATALYLYFQNVHDEESDVLTIHSNHSAWHHELNNRLEGLNA